MCFKLKNDVTDKETASSNNLTFFQIIMIEIRGLLIIYSSFEIDPIVTTRDIAADTSSI